MRFVKRYHPEEWVPGVGLVMRGIRYDRENNPYLATPVEMSNFMLHMAAGIAAIDAFVWYVAGPPIIKSVDYLAKRLDPLEIVLYGSLLSGAEIGAGYLVLALLNRRHQHKEVME